MNNNLINKQDAVEILEELKELDYERYVRMQGSLLNETQWDTVIENFKEMLNDVRPQLKTGRWIDDNCSECGQYVYHGDARNYCPNCGALMNG